LRHALLHLLHLALHGLFLAYLSARKYGCDELIDEEQDEDQYHHPCQHGNAGMHFALSPVGTSLATATLYLLRHFLHLP
jgi:hypothetical protein